MKNKTDYNLAIGLKKGMMLVVAVGDKIKGKTYLKGICDCGQEKGFTYYNFMRGAQLSCGCNRTPKTVSYDYKHPLYKIWISMRARCNNPKDGSYSDYGGRGVRVCDEWENSYQLFYDWCINNGWRQGLFLDKDTIGTGLLYSAEMCAIITRAENNQTRRMVKINHEKALEIRLSKEGINEIAARYDISRATVFDIRAYRTWNNI